MNYIEEIDKLLQAGIDAVKKDKKLRELMYTIYQDLFLKNGRCSRCGSKDSQYFIKIASEGKQRAKNHMSIAERTLKFRYNGNVYLPKAKVSYNLNMINDQKAVQMFNDGILPANLFVSFPSGYELQGNKLVLKEESKANDEIDTEEIRKLVNICKSVHGQECACEEKNVHEMEKDVIDEKLDELATEEKPTYQERMKTLFEEGKSAKEIAETLNSDGYLTSKGKEWSAQSVGVYKRYL